MIGIIAGDIIGSPYVGNPLPDTTSIFFPLFDSSSRIELDRAGRSARQRVYEARPGVITSLVLAVSDWLSAPGDGQEEWDGIASSRGIPGRVSAVEALAVCGPVADLASGPDEAASLVASVLRFLGLGGRALDDALVFTSLLLAVGGASVTDAAALRSILEGEGYDARRNSSEMRPFVTGMVVRGPEGRLTPGDGRPVRDTSQVLPAALAAFLESGSYEETVRRAVAIGGDSALTAALAGAIAERRYPVPDAIRSRVGDYLSAGDREVAARFERHVRRAREGVEVTPGSVRAGTDGTRFQVIRVEGMGSVYVVPEGMDEVESAIRRLGRRGGLTEKDYSIIRPDALGGELDRLSSRRAADGSVLDGTYAERPRPELRTLWLQDGEVRSPLTRGGTGAGGSTLPGRSVRAATWDAFMRLKEHVGSVRDTLDAVAGWDPGKGLGVRDRETFLRDMLEERYGRPYGEITGGMTDREVGELREGLAAELGERYAAYLESLKGTHMRFATAFYPVVNSLSVEIWKGDTLRARAGIDNDGRFRVDTDAKTGGFHSEGIEGVLDTMDLLPRNADMDDVRAAVDMYCLDYGRVEDDDERAALAEGDAGKVYEEAGAVRKRYESNIDRIHADMSALGDIIPVAVPPEGPRISESAAEAREARRAASEARYAGMTREEAVDSRAYKGSVFTVGHSNLSGDEFDALLRRHGIEVLVDARSYPRSRYCPRFDKEPLSAHLAGGGIEYHHFPEFGGHRYRTVTGDDGSEARVRLTYEEIMRTPEFRDGMRDLRDCVRAGHRVALMCSESDPMDCHRMVMLGRALAHPEVYGSRAKPIDVRHITRQGYTLSQDYFERRMVAAYSAVMASSLEASRRADILSRRGVRQAGELEAARREAAATSEAFRKAVEGEGDLARLIEAGDPAVIAEAYRMRGEALVSGREKGVSLRRGAAKGEAAAPARPRRRKGVGGF